MKLRDVFTILVGKSVYFVLRKTGRHGAALPGLIAERINPGLIKCLTGLPEGIIVVSGTNGKTTTTHLTAEVLRRAGKRVFTNHSGSNMTRGLLASIVRFASPTGKLPYDVAVLEIDEAYAAKLAPLLQPKACVLTNVLRDQLDRFGEIDHTAKLLLELAKHTKDIVVYNICDSRLQNINTRGKQRLVSYGYSEGLLASFPNDDDWYTETIKPQAIPRSDYTLAVYTENSIELAHNGVRQKITNSLLPGTHNALNLTAVVALISEIYPDMSADFSSLRPPFGRGEVVAFENKKFTLQLVKNPAGFRTAMSTNPLDPALIVINDAIADSRDVSWLWDVDVEPLRKRATLATSGTRAYDIANRLKYADIHVGSIEVDTSAAVREFVAAHNVGVIFLTYTAMLQTRKILHQLIEEQKK